METDEHDTDDFYWTIEMRTGAPPVLEGGARVHTAQLDVFHEVRGRIKSMGRAHFIVVPFGLSAVSFLDCADEVSSETLAAATFATSTVESAGGAGMVYISSVELDGNIRGQKLGLFLVTNAVRALTDLAPEAVAVLEPSPFHADELDTTTRRKAVEKLSTYWAAAGFVFDESDTDNRFMSVRAGELKDTDLFPPVPPRIIDVLR